MTGRVSIVLYFSAVIALGKAQYGWNLGNPTWSYPNTGYPNVVGPFSGSTLPYQRPWQSYIPTLGLSSRPSYPVYAYRPPASQTRPKPKLGHPPQEGFNNQNLPWNVPNPSQLPQPVYNDNPFSRPSYNKDPFYQFGIGNQQSGRPFYNDQQNSRPLYTHQQSGRPSYIDQQSGRPLYANQQNPAPSFNNQLQQPFQSSFGNQQVPQGWYDGDSTSKASCRKFYKKNVKCKCGLGMKFRIVGGYKVRKGRHPWIVGVYEQNHFHTPFCGGTLISEQWVLSAAHCFTDRRDKLDEILFHLGDHNIYRMDEKEVILSAEAIYIRREFDQSNGAHDVALIKLNRTIAVGKYIYPACLPKPHMNCDWNKEKIIVAGWGHLDEDTKAQPDILHENFLPVIPWGVCKKIYPRVTDKQFCTYRPNKDTCQGDSGGPGLVGIHGRFYLVGVVSWGIGCARAFKPGVYVDVAEEVPWIKSIAGDEICTNF